MKFFLRILSFLGYYFLVGCVQVNVNTSQIDFSATKPVELIDEGASSLAGLVNILVQQVNILQDQQKNDRELITELEKRTIGNNREIRSCAANMIQVNEHISEIKHRIEVLEEYTEVTTLDIGHIKLGQSEMKTSIAECRKFTDNMKRTTRKFDRKIEKKIHSLNSKFSNSLNQVEHLKSVFQNTSQSLSEQITIINGQISNSTNQNKHRNDLYHSILLKYSINSKRNRQTFAQNDQTSLEGSGEIDKDNLIQIKDSQPSIEPGSGDGENKGENSYNDYIKVIDFLQEIKIRDLEISSLHDLYFDLEDHIERMEHRLTSIQLGRFMEKLQQSLVNFTQNVITLDQWRSASTDIVNSTQVNQQQIQSLTHMILNNTKHLNDLEWKVNNINTLSYQQFNVLRMHVIQLNNTVQDIKEDFQKRKNGQGYHHRNNMGMGNFIPSQTNLDTILSRVDDLSLQIVFNENRLSKLELQSLNKSLHECRKTNSDIYQDDRIIFLERAKNKLEESLVKTQEMVRRLDLGVYRVYNMAKNHTDLLSTVFRDLNNLASFVPFIIESKRETDNFKTHLPQDCHQHFKQGNTESGVYIIHPFNASQSVRVLCNMSEEKGGWTIIQRRTTGNLDFSKDWVDYVNGFGLITAEYWFGLHFIYLLTSFKEYSLRIEMIDLKDVLWVAEYKTFMVEDETQNFKLKVTGYHGNATDGLGYCNEMGFSTPDRDNDASSTDCALYYLAGWWYKHCHYGNLNGRYNLGMVWYNFDTDEWLQMKSTIMMIKPN